MIRYSTPLTIATLFTVLGLACTCEPDRQVDHIEMWADPWAEAGGQQPSQEAWLAAVEEAAAQATEAEADEGDRDGDGHRAEHHGGGDCHDGDDRTHPGADELCNERDDDCDGEVDELGAIDAPPWYTEADAHGRGVEATAIRACRQPAAFAFANQDPIPGEVVDRVVAADDDAWSRDLLPYLPSTLSNQGPQPAHLVSADLDQDGEDEVALVLGRQGRADRDLAVLDRLDGHWRVVAHAYLPDWYGQDPELQLVPGDTRPPLVHVRVRTDHGTGIGMERRWFFMLEGGRLVLALDRLEDRHFSWALVHSSVETRFEPHGDDLHLLYDYAFHLDGVSSDQLDGIDTSALGTLAGTERWAFAWTPATRAFEPDPSAPGSPGRLECLDGYCAAPDFLAAFPDEIRGRLESQDTATRRLWKTYMRYLDDEGVVFAARRNPDSRDCVFIEDCDDVIR